MGVTFSMAYISSMLKAFVILSSFFAFTSGHAEVRSQFCNCAEITISSTGGVAEHLPETLGRYTSGPDLWEGMFPTWKNENGNYLTPDSNSNPILYYIKWVIGTRLGPYDGVIMNDVYTDGFDKCPWRWISGSTSGSSSGM